MKAYYIIDEYTREQVAFVLDRSIDALEITELWDVVAWQRGTHTRGLRIDNGPGFISSALAEWASEDATIQAFTPGQPWHNGFVESLHNRMRDEPLEQECFDDIAHPRRCLQRWSTRYNTNHLHSVSGFISPREYRKQYSPESA